VKAAAGEDRYRNFGVKSLVQSKLESFQPFVLQTDSLDSRFIKSLILGRKKFATAVRPQINNPPPWLPGPILVWPHTRPVFAFRHLR
jgi:hypothetical protein